MDGDTLQIGNLCRHTLDLDHVKDDKAAALAQHLNRASPHAQVVAISDHFPSSDANDLARVQACDVIIDCTGSDDALQQLAEYPWTGSRLFLSLSLGLRAKRLYCFSAVCTGFPFDAYRRLMSPWLDRDLEDNADQELPREGIGCWHPVFPARVDDVWMLAAVAAKHLEAVVEAWLAEPQLAVFEQQYQGGSFLAVHRTDSG